MPENELYIRKAVRDLMHTMPAEGWVFTRTTKHQFLALLNAKIEEEAHEVQEAFQKGDREALIEELADLYEVLSSYSSLNDISQDEIKAARQSKAIKRGRFWGRWIGEFRG